MNLSPVNHVLRCLNLFRDVLKFCLKRTVKSKCLLNRTPRSRSRLQNTSSLVLDHLLLDVLGHLVVEPEPLPLCVEGGGLAVPADEPVEPGGDVALDEVLGVDVQGLQEPRVPLQDVLPAAARPGVVVLPEHLQKL